MEVVTHFNGGLIIQRATRTSDANSEAMRCGQRSDAMRTPRPRRGTRRHPPCVPRCSHPPRARCPTQPFRRYFHFDGWYSIEATQRYAKCNRGRACSTTPRRRRATRCRPPFARQHAHPPRTRWPTQPIRQDNPRPAYRVCTPRAARRAT